VEQFDAPLLGLLGEFGFAGLAAREIVRGLPLALAVRPGPGRRRRDGNRALFADRDDGLGRLVVEQFDAESRRRRIEVRVPAGPDAEVVSVEVFGGINFRLILGAGEVRGSTRQNDQPGRRRDQPGRDLFSHGSAS
jgi:hypothetical protein